MGNTNEKNQKITGGEAEQHEVTKGSLAVDKEIETGAVEESKKRMQDIIEEKQLVKNTIQEHPVLEGFKIEVVADDNDKMDLCPTNIITPDGFRLEELDPILDAEKITEILEEVGYKWREFTYYSMHGGHKINTLVPSSLNLEEGKECEITNPVSLDTQRVGYLGTFGNQPVFISGGTRFGTNCMRGYSRGLFLITPSSDSRIYQAEIMGGGSDMLKKEEISIYTYQGSLLLAKSFKVDFFTRRSGEAPKITQQNSLQILVDSKGNLNQDIFAAKDIKISPARKGYVEF